MPKPKTTKKNEPKPVKSSKSDYFLEVSVNDILYKTEAKTLEEAITNFVQSPVYPVGAKTKFHLKFGKGDVSRRRLFQTPAARRLLTTLARKPAAITILAEQLTRSLEE